MTDLFHLNVTMDFKYYPFKNQFIKTYTKK